MSVESLRNLAAYKLDCGSMLIQRSDLPHLLRTKAIVKGLVPP